MSEDIVSFESAEEITGIADAQQSEPAEGEQMCLPCGRPCPTPEIVNGVCPRCKKNFEAKHKGKAKTKWQASDFKYPKAHYEQLESQPEGESETEMTIDRDDEKALEVLRRMKIGLNYCYRYSGNQQMAMHCFALAMGFRDIATNGKGQVLVTDEDIGGLYGVEKASVGKCKLDLQARMGIKPLDGQRSESARANMKKARKAQLKETKTK